MKEIPLLHYHRRRMMLSQLQLWNIFATFDLKKEILNAYEKVENLTLQQAKKVKCRVIYEMTILHIEFLPYETQVLDSLGIIEANDIEYNLKYTNRTFLNELKLKTNASDVLIVKNGYITDISYANVAFSNRKEWFTPKKPLLKGTKRQFLIEKNKLIETDIQLKDLSYFNQIMLFNAMMEKVYHFSIKKQNNSIILELSNE